MIRFPRLSVGASVHLKSNLWLSLDRLANFISAFLVGLFVIRYLGPIEFGVLSYLVAVSFFLSTLSRFGFDMIVVRELVKCERRRTEIIASAYVLRLSFALLIFAISLVYVGFFNDSTESSFYILLVASVGVFQSFEVIGLVLQSEERFKQLAIVKIVQTILSAALKLILIWFEAPLLYFIVALVADALLLALAYLILHSKIAALCLSFKRNACLSVMLNLVKASWPILLSAFSVALYTKMDQLMLSHLMGNYEVGVYSSSIRLVEASYFIPVVFASVCLPILVRARQASYEAYEQKARSIFSVMFYTGLLVGAVMYISAENVVPLLFGRDYLEAAVPFEILSLGTVFVYIGALTTPVLIANNLQRVLFYRTLSAALINIILNYFMISLWGIQGAAYATLITTILAAFIFDGVSQHTRYLMVLKLKGVIPQWVSFRTLFI